MHTSDALVHGVKDGQMVGIELDGVRGGVFRNVAIRVTDDSALELHVDMEEANAMSLTSASVVEIAN
jgi:propanediol utilization protein